MFELKHAIIIPGILVLVLGGCGASFVYHPTHDLHSTPTDVQLTYQPVTITTRDQVALSAWWVPAREPRGTVLFCHGNGGNITDCLDSLIIFNSLRLNALLFDYRGYGRSQGSPSEQGTYLDAEAAWDYLVTQQKTAPHYIIIWGRSLGGAIAARTAARHPAGLVIIESSFTSLPDVAHERIAWLPTWLLGCCTYDTRYYLEQVTAPILIIHSPNDETIPFHHGNRLYDAIKGAKSFLEIKGSHNQGFMDSREYYESGINHFIDRYTTQPEEGPSP